MESMTAPDYSIEKEDRTNAAWVFWTLLAGACAVYLGNAFFPALLDDADA